MAITSPFAPPACRRCHRRERVITLDGPPICRICVLAWGSLAGSLYAGTVSAEPSRSALEHLGHRTRRLGCWYCVSAVGLRPASGWAQA